MIILRQKDFARLLKRNPQFEKKVKRTAEEKMKMKLNKLVGTARAPRVKTANQMDFLEAYDSPGIFKDASKEVIDKYNKTKRETAFGPLLKKHGRSLDSNGMKVNYRHKSEVKDIRDARHSLNDITSGAEGVGKNTDLVIAKRNFNEGKWPSDEDVRKFWKDNKKKYYARGRGIWLAYP